MADAQITKKALAAAFKALVVQKGIDKVSVGDITKECGMGRQSFYYHFQDKFELLEWIYQHETFASLHEGVTLQNWSQRMEAALKVMEQDRKFYMATIKAHPDRFTECLNVIIRAFFLQVIEYVDVHNSMDEERRDFGAMFYAMGFSAIVVQWAQKGMRYPADKLAKEMYNMAKDSERAALRLITELGQ